MVPLEYPLEYPCEKLSPIPKNRVEDPSNPRGNPISSAPIDTASAPRACSAKSGLASSTPWSTPRVPLEYPESTP
jgi:hypothetical protein